MMVKMGGTLKYYKGGNRKSEMSFLANRIASLDNVFVPLVQYWSPQHTGSKELLQVAPTSIHNDKTFQNSFFYTSAFID